MPALLPRCFSVSAAPVICSLNQPQTLVLLSCHTFFSPLWMVLEDRPRAHPRQPQDLPPKSNGAITVIRPAMRDQFFSYKPRGRLVSEAEKGESDSLSFWNYQSHNPIASVAACKLWGLDGTAINLRSACSREKQQEGVFPSILLP